MPSPRRLLLAVLLLSLTLLPSSAAAARRTHQPQALTPLTLWLDWYPNSDHAGIYLAMAKGYYAQAGLQVQARVPSGSSDALTLVAHGSGDVAISYEPTLLIARAAHVPVVATAALVQSPLNCVMTLKSSGIVRPRQLEGKTIGIAGVPSDYTDVTAIISGDGGNPHLAHTIAVNYDLLTGLLSKKVDAVEGVYWTWEALQAQQSGHPVNVMPLDHYGVPTYNELIFASSSAEVQAKPALLRAFLRATFRGYADAAAHPAEAVQALLKAPGVLSRSTSLIEQSLHLLGPLFHDSHGQYGTLSLKTWQSYADWMTRTHLLSTHVDAATALTTALL